MANNRMYIRCRTCGEKYMIGKIYLEGYFIQERDKIKFYDGLEKFYNDHNFCTDEKLDKEINTENQFDIYYETNYKGE